MRGFAATVAVMMVGAGLASAGPIRVSVRVEDGDTLWRIARQHGCEVADLVRANRLTGSRIRAGGRLVLPPGCRGGDDRRPPAPRDDGVPRAELGQSVGRPAHGQLVAGVRLPDSRLWVIRRPARAYGASHVVAGVAAAIARAARVHPGHHPLAIGDLSAAHGGKITMHASHQSGRDIDLGFYFKTRPRGYPAEFVVATRANLDFDATWALISELAATADRPLGVQRMFLNYDTQALFYDLALDRGVARPILDRLFQYPYGRHSSHGLIHHEPGHDEHIHVRWKCPARDRGCD